MNQEKVKELSVEFVNRILNEAGAASAKAVYVRLPTPLLDDGQQQLVSCPLFSDNIDAIENLEFKSKQLPSAKLEKGLIWPELQRTRGWRFAENAGENVYLGKSNYPDFLRLNLTRSDAFTFALNILRSLEHPTSDPSPFIQIPIFGTLERCIDDDVEQNDEINNLE